MKRIHIVIGIILTLILLAAHLLILDDYGLTWDFHHHFFAGMSMLKQPIGPQLTEGLPFTEPDPRGTYKLPFGPLMSIAPVATYLVFFKWLGWLAFDNAYNLAIVLSGVAGVFILYLFLLEAFGLTTALAGFAFLALLPRFFGDLHNNMKDVPQAAAFTLAIWMFWRLVRYRRLKDLILASLAFAIAFNTKVNTIMVPVIAGMWMVGNWILDVWKLENRNRKKKIDFRLRISHIVTSTLSFPLLYFIIAPLAAFLLWSLFWEDPVGQLLYIPRFFVDNTQNIEVLVNGAWYCSGKNVPWWYPLWYLTITTPLPILFFFVIGFLTIVVSIVRSGKWKFVVWKFDNRNRKTTNENRRSPFDNEFRFSIQRISNFILLLLWFFLPIARYVFPKMGVIDGIRHFEEVVFPLSAIAAVGAVKAIRWLQTTIGVILLATASKMIPLVFVLFTFSFLLFPIVAYHPFQISYYNELVGGIRGAWGKYDIEYWGGPQKLAAKWLNEHAPKRAIIHVVMAADVAGTYLRPDLRQRLNTTGYDEADYVVTTNRQGFFYRYFYIWEYMLRRKTAYVVENQGVPIVWVFDNRLGQFPRGAQWWQGESPCIRKYWN